MGLKVGKRSGQVDQARPEPAGLPVPAWPLPPRLGPYRVGAVLGQGGMGRVHAAYDLVLRREVALKLLWRTEPGILARFLQEARFQARLDHPNICKIFEVEASGPAPYIAMQLVHGKGLLEAELDLEPRAVLDLMIQCAKAVHAAHAAGLIHRDLKPCNILLEADGSGRLQPMLLDFGLAKDLEGPGITVGSRVMGTPAYMAPEQAMGKGASVASDLYSLGATFYAFLAGRPPYEADSAAELLLRQSREAPPPLRSLNPQVSSGLAAILATCMERDPRRRYPSALALAEDLERLQHGRALRARRPLLRKLALAAGAALILAILVPLAWLTLATPKAPMAGLRGSLNHPVRVLLLERAEQPGDAWMSRGLAEATAASLANRSTILAIPVAAGPGQLPALARTYGADLAIVTSVARRHGLPEVTVATLRPGEREPRPLLVRPIVPGQYLATETELRRLLPARLGVSNPGGLWSAPQRWETRRATLEAQRLLAGPDLARGRAALREVIAAEPDYARPYAALAASLNAQSLEDAYAGRVQESDQHRLEALNAAERAIQLAPFDPAGYNELSGAQILGGELERAERSALQALKLAPLDLQAHWRLSLIENQRPGAEAYQAALGHARASLLLLPQDPQAHYRLGQLHLDVGQFGHAATEEERAIALKPDLGAAHLVRSNALIWSGRAGEAEAALTASLAVVPDYRLLRRNYAYTAFLTHDRAAFEARMAVCRDLWPLGNSTRDFLDGLADAFDGHWHKVRAHYGATLARIQRERKRMHYTVRTSASIDLYLMARVLAEGPDRRAAIPYIELSQSLYSKRKRMAQRDPAFQGLWPQAEPWPGDQP
jgi:tetratricopeptide (TPR) repeat protein